MSYADSLSSGAGATSISGESEIRENTTQDLLERLDSVSEAIPRILDGLAGSLGTFVAKPPGVKDDREQWEQALTRSSAYYYGLLDQVQTDLRSVVRQIRLDSRSPLTLRPPPTNPTIPLPSAFSPVPAPVLTDEGGEPLSATTESGFGYAVGQGNGNWDDVRGGQNGGRGDGGLGVYAQRMEVKVLEDLARALKEVKDERKLQREASESST